MSTLDSYKFMRYIRIVLLGTFVDNMYQLLFGYEFSRGIVIYLRTLDSFKHFLKRRVERGAYLENGASGSFVKVVSHFSC